MISPRFALLAVASVLLYLGLAVLGWGGVAAFFADPARLALAAVTLALTGASLFSGGTLSPGVREDRSNRWVIAVFSLLGLLLAWLPAYTDRLGFLTIDGDAVRWLGVILYTLGGALRLWPVFVLGNRFSALVAIQPGHRLVTDGIYGVVRNPSYLGVLVNALGWALAFRSLPGVLVAACFLPLLQARMRSEEKLLRAQFGSEYDAYCARTPRLVPDLSRWLRGKGRGEKN
ncbi:phospholipid methyltransferase [Desulfovibrio sp. X2]|uniref:methyltransferase family protein n=1 Tax=Desulfovibrio sp. X2 TaxID=941449 RepID=UPI0003589A4F|nr:isoprenylcysteine carboxylmethyltransferase family protein [Desulfovibrio sp. X2]EPR44230.1 phospholipid methyltransferase [Desulfovibrio sp. X2]